MDYKKISIRANYGWENGNRSTVIEVPIDEIDKIEDYVKEFVFGDISWHWEDITPTEGE